MAFRLILLVFAVNLFLITSVYAQSCEIQKVRIYIDTLSVFNKKSINDSFGYLKQASKNGIRQALEAYSDTLGYLLVDDFSEANYIAKLSINYGDWVSQRFPKGFFEGRYTMALVIYDKAYKDTVSGRFVNLDLLQKGNLEENIVRYFGKETLPNSCIVPLHGNTEAHFSEENSISISVANIVLKESIDTNYVVCRIKKAFQNTLAYYTKQTNYYNRNYMYQFNLLDSITNKADFELNATISNLDRENMTIMIKLNPTSERGIKEPKSNYF